MKEQKVAYTADINARTYTNSLLSELAWTGFEFNYKTLL